MLKNNNTTTPPAHQRRVPQDDEPIRRWINLPITKERACQLVDLLTRYDDGEIKDALIELICGLTPHMLADDKHVLDKRFLAGSVALMHAFTETRRAENEVGAYVVQLKCARWA
jgi:hypothetical protein